MMHDLVDLAEAAAIAEFDGGLGRDEAERAVVEASGHGNRIRSALRLHQAQALEALKQAIGRGSLRPVVQAPTGFGKTILAAEIVAGALAKGNRVLFVVPAIDLIDQTVEAFGREGITDVGVIQGQHILTDWGQPVQVASVQTLRRRPLPEADVVLIDECHRWFEFYGQWMALEGWKNIPFIGLSATPWTKGLGKHYDELIIASTTRDLIDAGYLSQFRVFAPDHPDLTGVRTVAGDYHEGQLSDAMNKPKLVADVVSTWLRMGEGRPTLVFGVDRAHARHLQQMFIEAGVPAGYQDAETPSFERAAIKRKFHTGEFKVVCNVGTLTMGIDWDVRCIVLARPTKSEMLLCQIIGRGLRTAPGKRDCLVLDHSDSTLNLGLVTDIHHDELDDGTKQKASAREKKKALPKECSKCSYLKPVGHHKCPSCGFEPVHSAPVEWQEGRLAEITGGKRRKSAEIPLDEKESWYAQLLGLAVERGYKSGWAFHKYREKFATNPPSIISNVEPRVASQEVRSWVKSRQIAWAKSNKRRAS